LETIGVPMKRDYLVYTGFDKSNMADKINGYKLEKYDWFSPKKLNINYFTGSDNYSLRTLKCLYRLRSTFPDLKILNFDPHHVSDATSKDGYSAHDFYSGIATCCNANGNPHHKNARLNS
jgi:hypothetical protein